MVEKYSIPEFLQMERDKETMAKLGINESISKNIMRNKKLKQLSILALATIFSCRDILAEAAPKAVNAITKVDAAGSVILLIVRRLGYWVCIILCFVEVIRCLANGDTKQVGRIVAKYLIAFGIFFILPWLFDIIAEIFG